MNVTGNEQTHQLALRSTEKGRQSKETKLLKLVVLSKAERPMSGKELFSKSSIGLFTKQLDKALPGRHTKQLYDRLNRDQASRLCQLRTGRCRLNSYLNKIHM